MIRDEESGDVGQVDAVVRSAFGGAHGDVVGAVVEDLRRLPGVVSLVAEDAERPGEIAGHVMFTPAILDAPERLVSVAVLSPLAVRPDRRRAGIGSALVRHGLAMLAGTGVPAVFLEGDPRYYGRLGFRAGGELGFRRPSLRIPAAAFQVVTLPAHEGWMTGTLVCPSVFWRHDAVGLRPADGFDVIDTD